MGRHVVRGRFWAKMGLVGMVVLAVVTALVPDWLERLGGEGGDAGGGGTERAIAIGLLLAAALVTTLTWVEWRRPLVPALARDGSGAGGV